MWYACSQKTARRTVISPMQIQDPPVSEWVQLRETELSGGWQLASNAGVARSRNNHSTEERDFRAFSDDCQTRSLRYRQSARLSRRVTEAPLWPLITSKSPSRATSSPPRDPRGLGHDQTCVLVISSAHTKSFEQSLLILSARTADCGCSFIVCIQYENDEVLSAWPCHFEENDLRLHVRWVRYVPLIESMQDFPVSGMISF
jgi:hypothetical protein